MGLPGKFCQTPGHDIDQCAAEAAWASVEVAKRALDLATHSFWASAASMVFVALAAFFAFRAYREAATANTIARESAIRQDRAYLDFETVGYDSIQQIPGTDASIIMRIEFKNFGHTPADDLALEIEYGLFRCSDKVRLKGEKETLTGLGAVMPQDTWGRSTKFAVSNGEFLALQTNTYEIRATIGATYLDAFEEPREVTSTFVGSGAKSIMGFIPGTRSHT